MRQVPEGNEFREYRDLQRGVLFRSYLWLCWCCARANRKVSPECDRLLAALCRNERWTGDVLQTDGEPVRYLPSLDCLQIRPSDKALHRALGGCAAALKTFYAGKTIHDTLTEFGASSVIAAWSRTGSLEWKDRLRDEKRLVFAGILGRVFAPMPYLGVPVIGYGGDEHVVLLGIRDVPGISCLSPGERYWWLCQPEGTVTRYPEERVGAWWTAERDDEVEAWVGANPGSLRAMVEDLLRDADGSVPTVIVVGDGAKSRPAIDGGDVVFASTRNWLTAATWALKGITEGVVSPRVEGHQVFAREHFAAYLSRCPWVWTTHVVPGFPVRFVSASALYDVLCPGGRSREQLWDREVVGGVVRNARGVVITGGEGCGKSVALAQYVMREFSGSLCAVVTRDATSSDLAVLVGAADAGRSVVVVVDDVHLIADDVLRGLERCCRERGWLFVGAGLECPQLLRDVAECGLGLPSLDDAKGISVGVLGYSGAVLFLSRVRFWCHRLAVGDCTVAVFVGVLDGMVVEARSREKLGRRLERVGDRGVRKGFATLGEVLGAASEGREDAVGRMVLGVRVKDDVMDRYFRLLERFFTGDGGVRASAFQREWAVLSGREDVGCLVRAAVDVLGDDAAGFAEFWEGLLRRPDAARLVGLLRALGFARWCGLSEVERGGVTSLFLLSEGQLAGDGDIAGLWREALDLLGVDECAGWVDLDTPVVAWLGDEGLSGQVARLCDVVAGGRDSLLLPLQRALVYGGVPWLLRRGRLDAASTVLRCVLGAGVAGVAGSVSERCRVFRLLAGVHIVRGVPEDLLGDLSSLGVSSRVMVGLLSDVIVLHDARAVGALGVEELQGFLLGPLTDWSSLLLDAQLFNMWPYLLEERVAQSDASWVVVREALLRGMVGCGELLCAMASALERGAVVRVGDLLSRIEVSALGSAERAVHELLGVVVTSVADCSVGSEEHARALRGAVARFRQGCELDS